MHAAMDAPTEILQIIFEEACHAPGAHASEDVPLQVAISQVCRSWRAVAIGSPKLWSQYTYWNGKNFIKELDRLAHYLERSHNQLLDLSFRLEPYDLIKKPVLRPTSSLSVESRALSLVQKATEHAGRWRRILVHIDGETEETYPDPPQSPLVFLQQISLPNLETFELITSERFASPEYVSALAGMAPKLNFIRIDAITLLSFTLSQNITTLEIEWTSSSIHRSPILLALREVIASPTLISFSIRGVPSRMSPPAEYYENVQAKVSNLKHLRCSNTIAAPTLFFRIRYPQLESLTLKDLTIAHIAWKFPPSILGGIFPALRTLAFIDCGLNESEHFVYSIAKHANNISHLYVLKGAFRMNYKCSFYNLMLHILEGFLHSRDNYCKNLTFFVNQAYDSWQDEDDIRIYRRYALEGRERGTVRLPSFIVDRYKVLDDGLWRELEDSGVLEVIAGQNLQMFLPPWPARSGVGESEGLGHGTRDPFYAASTGGIFKS
ncbi:hypothetical protein JR316_0003031 [Psilocybe cubensis]|uniref:F-box domain-containing protein n=2 Tax=Psilocybe cubensis TaxID=181762 RepID=A0A8H8CLJ7_PSICU|nr:hypothetical protein JR316_0003031 [Psilocybe cubensis]KAH9483561.1 hypothetical protein JR316_0003031 [Psilocybe cubensis]